MPNPASESTLVRFDGPAPRRYLGVARRISRLVSTQDMGTLMQVSTTPPRLERLGVWLVHLHLGGGQLPHHQEVDRGSKRIQPFDFVASPLWRCLVSWAMGWKAWLSKPLARATMSGSAPVAIRWLPSARCCRLWERARETAFGRDHGFQPGMTVQAFQERVPVRDYEGLKGYVDRAVAGEQNVLWPGEPLYFCKTSGTTSGAKFIPDGGQHAQPHRQRTQRLAGPHRRHWGRLVCGRRTIFAGKPGVGQDERRRPFGTAQRHCRPPRAHLPAVQLAALWEANCIEDWETKVDAIVKETCMEDLLASGIPSWVQMYFERLLEHTGAATVQDASPTCRCSSTGVSRTGSTPSYSQLLGFASRVLSYPASKGSCVPRCARRGRHAAQRERRHLLRVHPGQRILRRAPRRLTIEEVELGVQYAVVLSTNAGLWAYDIGDTVKFVSLDPPRVLVTGRISTTPPRLESTSSQRKWRAPRRRPCPPTAVWCPSSTRPRR